MVGLGLRLTDGLLPSLPCHPHPQNRPPMADAKVVRLKLREMLAASNMETESQRTLTRKLEEELGFPLDPHKALIKAGAQAAGGGIVGPPGNGGGASMCHAHNSFIGLPAFVSTAGLALSLHSRWPLVSRSTYFYHSCRGNWRTDWVGWV